MAIGFYIVPYKRRAGARKPTRYCAIDDYTPNILASGGLWAEAEILGDRAIVKVRASAAILQTLNGVFKRLPKDSLDTSLADLSSGQKTALRNELQDQGYSLAEIQARFGNDLGQFTLRDVLRFMATRRRKPRYDAELDAIILDGDEQACRPVEDIDSEIV